MTSVHAQLLARWRWYRVPKPEQGGLWRPATRVTMRRKDTLESNQCQGPQRTVSVFFFVPDELGFCVVEEVGRCTTARS